MLEGILLVDKKVGESSFDVVAKVRRALSVRSVGHAGTLDPFATGLLLILVGRYTRLSGYLTNQDKTYEARICLGVSTATDDCCGDIISQSSVEHITQDDVQCALQELSGEHMQMPPQFSAISIKGERAYKMARRGEAVDLVARPVNIRELKLVRYEAPYVDIVMTCSKGTYVRSLGRDLGIKLGVGAHVTELRRTHSGEYNVVDAQPIAIENLCGFESIRGIAKIEVTAKQAMELRQGKRPRYDAALNEIALAHIAGELVAIVQVIDGCLVSVRGF